MSPRKLVFLTAVVLLLFGFIVLFERKMPTTAEKERKGDVVWEIPESRIESIRGGSEHGESLTGESILHIGHSPRFEPGYPRSLEHRMPLRRDWQCRRRRARHRRRRDEGLDVDPESVQQPLM